MPNLIHWRFIGGPCDGSGRWIEIGEVAAAGTVFHAEKATRRGTYHYQSDPWDGSSRVAMRLVGWERNP